MPYPNASYVDGLQAVVALSVYCYNNGLTYMTYNGDPSTGAAQTENRNSDNQLIGSVTYIDGRKGTLALQYALATDEAPSSANEIKTSYIVSFRGRFYVVGAVKTPIVKNDVIKMSCDVTELQNPFVSLLLSTLGQQKRVTIASGSLPTTISCAASNTRTGATVAYSVETFATPGSAAPSGITINSSSGLLTAANTLTAGTYDVRAVVSDTVTLADGTSNTIYGFGRYTLTVT
jgi:hypothetical protein